MFACAHGTVQPPSSQSQSAAGAGRDFKAVVILWFYGGLDSYNVLVPYKGHCNTKNDTDGSITGTVGATYDLHEEYKYARQGESFGQGVGGGMGHNDSE